MYYSEQMASDILIFLYSKIYDSLCQSVHGNIGHGAESHVRQDVHFGHHFLSLSHTRHSVPRESIPSISQEPLNQSLPLI